MNTEFLITSLIVVASPGTGVLVTLAAGLSRGARAAVAAALGCTLGILPHLLAAVTGLGAVLRADTVAFDTIRYAGAAYLLYMAWSALQEDGALRTGPGAPDRSSAQTLRRAILVNLLNPKLPIFFFAFLPQFIDGDDTRPVLRLLELSLVFMGMTFAVFAAYGVLAARVGARILSRPRFLGWMRRGFAATFLALGIRLLLS